MGGRALITPSFKDAAMTIDSIEQVQETSEAYDNGYRWATSVASGDELLCFAEHYGEFDLSNDVVDEVELFNFVYRWCGSKSEAYGWIEDNLMHDTCDYCIESADVSEFFAGVVAGVTSLAYEIKLQELAEALQKCDEENERERLARLQQPA
jgi:hypothetical protein